MMKNKQTLLLDTLPRKQFFIQAAAVTIFSYLTSGVFLSGMAIFMGTADVLVSYLSIIINICGVLTLAFSVFLERFKSRKKLTIWLTVLSRITTLLIVAVPAMQRSKPQQVIFISLVIIAFTLQAQTTVVLNQWMFCFVDENKSGRYISLRQTMTLAATVICSFLGGWWMDFMEGKYIGFIILFAAAAASGVGDILILLRIPDCPLAESIASGCKFREIMKIPLKNRAFTAFVVYIFTFYLLLNIADSFTMVYMMKYLALPYKTVTAMYLIISLPQLIFLGVWGKISDKYGHAFALKTSIWLFTGETFFMFFASPSNWFIFIPIAFLFASLANAGFIIAVFNRRYELMPNENRIIYDNFYTAFIGLGFILGPMIGGACKGFLETIPAMDGFLSFGSIRILYLISTAGILILQLVYRNCFGVMPVNFLKTLEK